MNEIVQRIELQKILDAKKTTNERRKLGQFSTPQALAEEIVSFGIDLLEGQAVRFFDPAFGTGAFYAALRRKSDGNKMETATGIEIDPHYAKPTQELWKSTPVDIKIGDFMKLPPERRYNLLICNPPYVRHHLIDDKENIWFRTMQLTGVKLSGLAGLYCHFLLQSVCWMEPDGVAGWLVPSEFMDVNYGKKIKDFLLNNVELIRIHRFDPTDAQFDDALVSSAIVWFRNRAPHNVTSVSFSYGGTLLSPKTSKDISVSELKKETKWTRFPLQDVRSGNNSEVLLGDYFSVKRGIATGNNRYFILDKGKIEVLDLPQEVFRPVLPNSRYLNSDEIFADENGNPILEQELFLLDCKLPEYEVQMRYPKLWDYLLTGIDSVSNGYLCKSRKCWYYQEQREAPLFICTYMSRSRKNDGRSFRFILNHSVATVTNCYLALYPKGEMKKYLVRFPHMINMVWKYMNQIDPQCFADEGRVYGGGLRKVEPAELMRIPVPKIDELVQQNVCKSKETNIEPISISILG